MITLVFILALFSTAAWAWLLLRHGGVDTPFWRIEPPRDAPDPRDWPAVVAVIPARNEAESIVHAVKSLLRQDYPGAFRVVVVDDNSSDETAAIAHDAAALLSAEDRLTVLTGSPLPAGWTGKVWAMSQGLTRADAFAPDYVLFTDADIWHGHDALRLLVAEAEADGLDLASRMVRLRVVSWAERAIIPAFVYFFRLLYPFSAVGRTDSPVAGAAGGCMLVRRSSLAKAGDLKSIQSALIDDCALARVLKDHGGRLSLRLAEDSDSIRPYPQGRDLWMMIARSAYTQLRTSPGLLGGSLMGLGLLFIAPPLAVLVGLLAGHAGVGLLGLAAWAMMAITYAPMVRFYRRAWPWIVALPAVALFYMAATLDSARRHHQGRGGAWKGRVQGSPSSNSVEFSSGKDKGDENFPVGSWLIAKPLRPHVHAFYRFARLADDIADSADFDPQEKLSRLDQMAAVLRGETPDSVSPAAAKLRESLAISGVSSVHAHELLDAFRQDAVKTRYADWDDLMAYCRLSAAPVGRYLLDLHGEDHATWPAADALCAALQVINHLQDCGDDYRSLDRVYIPDDLLHEAGLTVATLALPASDPAFRRVLDQLVALTEELVREARQLAPQVRNTGLRRETAIITALAERLLVTLSEDDPLAERATLGPLGVLAGVLTGLSRSRAGRDPLLAMVETKVKQSGSSFYRGMRLLSRPQREAMYAVYAFCREVDDIADDEAPLADKRAGLSAWRDEIAALYRGQPTRPIARALCRPIARYGLLQEDFVAIIDGCAMDTGDEPFRPDSDALRLYCDRVASAVGRLSVKIFGAPGLEGVAVADALGKALQLTNILRDVVEDAAIGRLYLPSDVLAKHGITSSDPASVAHHPALSQVCREVGAEAEAYYQSAYTAMRHCPRSSMRPARLMAASYHALLRKMARHNWMPSDPPLKVNKFIKLWFVVRHGLV